ncbi:SurA N-terminal domain-containing protein [Pelovirga terrestris]|uniref:SurA N-terminal domain-containing protein n=1 Tax=Pelovirga terrestris TaxID=2771352 RepID=A0A8J6QSI0_9BACT|nr:SurA N-terminal domain-containing protein [Pelovirga terrestris]MBD1400810.1 SurA N-terminal domain-containing protein [Pelovirga terrestris]
MKRFTFWFLLMCLSVPISPLAAQTIASVAAVVNSDIITTYQLDRAVERLVSSQNLSRFPSDQERQQLRREVLDQLINDRLLQQRSKELGLSVTTQEVDAAVDDVMTSNNLNPATLETALAAEGMSLESYRRQIHDEILRYKLMSQEVNYRARVTSGEVRRYFEENIEQFDTQTRLFVSRISFALPADRSSSDAARIEEQANQSRQRLLGGTPFDTVLAEAGPLADGGIMGELVLSDLAAPLQQALQRLATGDISVPTEFNQQLHLFIVNDRRSGEELAFERAKASIEERLRREKTEARFIEWQEELLNNAYIDRRL